MQRPFKQFTSFRTLLLALLVSLITVGCGGGGSTPTQPAVNTAPFITTWKTDNPGNSADDQITISTSGTQDYTVDWGDGNTDENVTGSITHTYASPGTYTVSISGTFTRFMAGADAQKLLSVEQWGDQEWTSMASAFEDASNFVINATDRPNLSQVTSMVSMFRNASAFNQDISQWDVAAVTNMGGMFRNASAFNQAIGQWNVAAVTNMGGMFRNASAFNQDISQWNVAAVTDMGYMFSGATAFNQAIGQWNVAAVTNMSSMFAGVTLSTANYDALLSGWSGQTVQNNVFFSAGNSQYSAAAQNARDVLVNTYNWTITDDGLAP